MRPPLRSQGLECKNVSMRPGIRLPPAVIHSLLADADLNRAIVNGLIRRNSTIDFQTAAEVPLEGLADPEVISLAARLGRLLVSHDVNTMPGHLREFAKRKRSPGLVLIRQNIDIGTANRSSRSDC